MNRNINVQASFEENISLIGELVKRLFFHFRKEMERPAQGTEGALIPEALTFGRGRYASSKMPRSTRRDNSGV